MLYGADSTFSESLTDPNANGVRIPNRGSDHPRCLPFIADLSQD